MRRSLFERACPILPLWGRGTMRSSARARAGAFRRDPRFSCLCICRKTGEAGPKSPSTAFRGPPPPSGEDLRGRVEFGVVAEDAVLVEGEAAVGGQVGADGRQG